MTYELTYIIRPDLDSEAKTALVERFDKILTDNGATVADSKDWSTRRFAYEISGYHEGTYRVINFSANDDAAINEFDRLAKISQDILRHMIVKREA
ncbi:30S ribosomal protein S6 [Periweissella cryptocerci]|uniref:Small ribosomal subunit protein bS6 n=1 Tax=Periweissella cryptocerci TaxID=2506420 RepID=A0A4P6YTZ7_9LACO|nr:30S ribosomal protein S6 [Periweissella cryptocerci]QBO36249.1 30S ribosomal protein S6 [Periweissella cryptocerci]